MAVVVVVPVEVLSVASAVEDPVEVLVAPPVEAPTLPPVVAPRPAPVADVVLPPSTPTMPLPSLRSANRVLHDTSHTES